MANVSVRSTSYRKIVRSRAFRGGWEDYRLSRTVRFDEWGVWSLAYEMGRQVAALEAATGDLIPVPDKAKIHDCHLEVLEQASRRWWWEARC